MTVLAPGLTSSDAANSTGASLERFKCNVIKMLSSSGCFGKCSAVRSCDGTLTRNLFSFISHVKYFFSNLYSLRRPRKTASTYDPQFRKKERRAGSAFVNNRAATAVITATVISVL